MHEADECPEPPVRLVPGMERRHVDQRKNPAVCEMREASEQLRAIAGWCKNGAEQIRQVHSCHAEALAGGKNRREHDGAGEAPQ